MDTLLKSYTTIAPAKAILFGEHSVVYPGHRAVLSALNLELHTTVTRTDNEQGYFKIRGLSNNAYDLDLYFTKEDICATYDKAETFKAEFIKTGDFNTLSSFLKSDKNIFKILLGVCINEIEKKAKFDGYCDVIVSSNIPFGSGFGSSASIGAGVSSAFLNAYDIPATKDDIFGLTYKFEEFQHGNPSGADPAAVVYGGLIEYSKNPEGGKNIERIEFNNKDLDKLFSSTRIIHTGPAEQTTGDVVEFVKRNMLENPNKYNKYFSDIDAIIDEFVIQAKTGSFSQSKYISLINNNGQILEEIGIVSELGKNIISRIRKFGGSAKVSGSGGWGKYGCGAMIVYHEDPNILQKIAEEYNVTLLDACFGAKGI